MSNAGIRLLEQFLSEAVAEQQKLELEILGMRAALERAYARQETKPESTTVAKELRNLMVDVLKEAGEPLHYGEIYERVVASGFNVPGQDPKRNVGAHLSNDDRFEKAGNGRWALTSWEKPEVVTFRARFPVVARREFDVDPPDDEVPWDDQEPTELELRELMRRA